MAKKQNKPTKNVPKKVKFKDAFNSFRKDQVATLPGNLATRYISEGVAEPFVEEHANQANLDLTGKTGGKPGKS